VQAPSADRGDTLVEILVALAILSIGIVALVGALGTNATTTIVNRSQSQASATLLAAAEYVKGRSPSASCAPGTVTTLSTAEVPHDPTFIVTYGPGRQLGTTPCADLAVIPVRVTTRDGFDLTVDVADRP